MPGYAVWLMHKETDGTGNQPGAACCWIHLPDLDHAIGLSLDNACLMQVSAGRGQPAGGRTQDTVIKDVRMYLEEGWEGGASQRF